MKNKIGVKFSPWLYLSLLLLCGAASKESADEGGSASSVKYFWVYTDAQTSEGGVGYIHHLYSNPIQSVDIDGSIDSDVLSQWLDVIKINHPDLIKLYGQDAIYRRSYVWKFDTREKAEKEKREYMAKSTEEEAKIVTVSFVYYED